MRLIDVGGVGCDRRKWIRYFEDVHAVIFCVALSDYDLKSSEDGGNLMHEALQLFNVICNLEWFRFIPKILLLNKKDIFQQKITKVPLTVCFPHYEGGKGTGQEFTEGIAFIQQQFMEQNHTFGNLVHPLVTCAIDARDLEFAFAYVRIFVLQNVLDPLVCP
jgi:hypothetical protein